MDKCKENVIEFEKGAARATVSFSQGRYKNRIISLKEKFPLQVCDVTENADGSLVAHIPTSWIKINPPRQMQLSDLERDERKERLIQARQSKRE